MTVSILHLSDLHRDASNPITNVALLESLAREKERYVRATPSIRPPDLIVISGDIVVGVPPDVTNADELLANQYSEASYFLSQLAELFLDGRRARIILVPGNHDVSYPIVKASLKEVAFDATDVALKPIVDEYVARLYTPGSTLRWSWPLLRFYEVADPTLYANRFEPFSNFYASFYENSRSYSLDPGSQFDLFDYPELGVVFAAFNSCHENDPLNRVGSIHDDCLAGAARVLRDTRYRGQLRAATWHHSTSGPPARVDYMHRDTLQVMIDNGFSIGLHGHQHKPQFFDEEFLLGEDRKIAVISAGTLCGGPGVLPAGQRRSYNVIEVDCESLTGRLHLREMMNESFGSPIWGQGSFSSTTHGYRDFTISPPPIHADDRLPFTLEEAEAHLKAGDVTKAIELAEPYVARSDLARRIALEAVSSAGDTRKLIDLFYPPTSTAEIVHVADALWKEKDDTRLRELLQNPLVAGSREPAVTEVIRKYSARLRDA